MASILSAIGWLLRCEERNEEDPLGSTFENDRHSRGVQLAEPGQPHQVVLGFFHSLRLLIQAIFSPSSVPLIPALPQVRKRYVKHSVMEKLSKSDKAQYKDEECYICLRPIGTKHLALKEASASASATAATSLAFSPSSKLDVGEVEEGDENERGSSSGSGVDDENDSDFGEKELFFSTKHQEQEQQQHSESQRQPQRQQQPQQREEETERRRRQRRKKSPSSSSPPRLILALPCGHRFCDCCVRRWLASHASCPTCRYQFPQGDCEVVKEP